MQIRSTFGNCRICGCFGFWNCEKCAFRTPDNSRSQLGPDFLAEWALAMPTQAPEPPGGASRLDSFVCFSACYFSFASCTISAYFQIALSCAVCLRTAKSFKHFQQFSFSVCPSKLVNSGADSAPSTWSPRLISQGVCMLPARGASDLARRCRFWPHTQHVEPPTYFPKHFHAPSTWSLRPGSRLQQLVPTLAAFLAAFACSQHVEPPTWRDASVAGTDSGPFRVAFRHLISSSKPVEQCCCARSSD